MGDVEKSQRVITFNLLTEITGGKIIQNAANSEIRYLCVDSRKVIASPHTLFFAIRGERHDGHDYIENLIAAGIKQFVVEKEISGMKQNTSCNFIEVNSSVEALQSIAAYHREKFYYPVMAVTGSSGKTIIKEWLYQLLQNDRIVFRSPRSYNSQIGVPLSVWQLNPHHELAIIEAGISQPGEMEKLEKIIRPDIGLFTNIGTAHDSGFTSTEEKIREKIKLFRRVKQIIYCVDNPQVNSVFQELKEKEFFAWSAKGNKADLTIQHQENSKTIYCSFREKKFQVEVLNNDLSTVENSAHCIAAMICLNIPVSEIEKRFRQLTPVSMRLELKKGINNCYLIDDSYNNDLVGLEIALDFLNHQNHSGTQTVILSDILTSGLKEVELYEQVAQLLEKKKIDRLIGVGEGLTKMQEEFSQTKSFFKTTDDLLQNIKSLTFQNEIILIKGARNFKLEKVVEKLQQKTHSSVLEINLDAITHNLNSFKASLKPGVEIMAMVKAFAYGSGIVEIARWLQFHQVNYLAVAYADEGVMLRNHGVELPIMVMNPAADSLEKIISHNLEPEIYSAKILQELLEVCRKKNDRVSIHLKVDTGMHRLGFEENELVQIKSLLAGSGQVTVESVFTHLAAQENPDHDTFTLGQIARFEKMYSAIVEWIDYRPRRHILNSAGIIRFPQYQFEQVRLGIGLYGVDPVGSEMNLLPVGTFKTIISQIKNITAGETIGYGRMGVVKKDTRVATIPVGYADGFDRRFGNGVGSVLVNGKKASVIGNVCMDMTMIDLGAIEADEGDEVIIFGEGNPITTLAQTIGTIPYELLTGIGDRVKRVFVSG